jgi:hypothetical protein
MLYEKKADLEIKTKTKQPYLKDLRENLDGKSSPKMVWATFFKVLLSAQGIPTKSDFV